MFWAFLSWPEAAEFSCSVLGDWNSWTQVCLETVTDYLDGLCGWFLRYSVDWWGGFSFWFVATRQWLTWLSQVILSGIVDCATEILSQALLCGPSCWGMAWHGLMLSKVSYALLVEAVCLLLYALSSFPAHLPGICFYRVRDSDQSHWMQCYYTWLRCWWRTGYHHCETSCSSSTWWRSPSSSFWILRLSHQPNYC